MNRKAFAWFSVIVFIAAMALCPISKMMRADEQPTTGAVTTLASKAIDAGANSLHFNKLAKEECCFGHKSIFKKAALSSASGLMQHPALFLLLVSILSIIGLLGYLESGARIPKYYSLVPVRGNPIYLQYRNLLI